MQSVDWFIVLAYIALTLALGVYLARRASGSLEDFFVSGRSLPWWLAGTSMAATTFSIDTPLYVAGVVGNRGIAGNWEWWAFAVSHVVLIYVFASIDPVSLDQACLDLIDKQEGKRVFGGRHALDYAESIGLGRKVYTLVQVN